MSQLWEFKYAPKTFEDLILSKENRDLLKATFEKKPNMYFVGDSGVGKGSFVDVFLKTLDCPYIKINGSIEGIDAVREKIEPFAKTMSRDIKYVYINECDRLSKQAQDSLKDLQEVVNKWTRFILCANDHSLMDKELLSRYECYNLSNPPAKDVALKCFHILDTEGVKYNKSSVIELVKKIWAKCPDIRQTIISLRLNVVDGVLNETVSIASMTAHYEQILAAMKTGDPENVRKLFKTGSVDYISLYKFIYEELMEKDVFSQDAEAVVLIGDHSYRDNTLPMALKEVNFMNMYFKMIKGKVL